MKRTESKGTKDGRAHTGFQGTEPVWRALFDAASEAILVVDSAGVILTANAKAEAIFGYGKSELIGQVVEHLLPETLRSKHADHRAGFMADPATRSMGIGLTLFGNRKDGTRFPVEVGLSFVKTQQGDFVLSFVQDITIRRQVEEHCSRLYELSIDMVCTLSFDGRITRVNPAWERVLGYAQHELLGKPYLELVHPEDRAAIMGKVNALMAGDGPVSFTSRHGCKDGACKWLSWNAVPSVSDKAIYCVIRDVTEAKRDEEKLLALATQLARSNQELQDFAFVASHDLQEPLRKIQTFGERLSSKYNDILGEAGQDYIERMRNAAVRMQALIADMLVYSRVTTKALPFKTVSLSEVLQGVLSDLEIRIEQTGGTVEIDGNLPIIEADPLQMRQLFQNLIGNSLKYLRDDAPPVVRVAHEVVREPLEGPGVTPLTREICRISIADNGIGFEQEYSERIFGMLQRLHGREKYPGTGIGLAICRKIAERHGGTISATSTPGKGSVFTVELPIRQAPLWERMG